MFCPGCGTNNEDGARFCYRCGRQLSDGTSTEPKTGPAWTDFTEPEPKPEPIIVPLPPEPLEPPPLPPIPPTPQIVIGKPKREMPLGMLAAIVLGIGLLGGAIAGVYFAVQSLDKDSVPIIGKDDDTPTPDQPAILASLASTCKDVAGQTCNLLWDIKGVKIDANAARIEYELSASGQTGCSVVILTDQAVTGTFEGAGRPGPFLEGARGRYYPLRSGEGITSTGGTLPCGSTQKGAWVFAPVPGEAFVKLRYPGVPPVRIDVSPLAVTLLPSNDPYSVVPVQQTTCQTIQNQACNGLWEIGPYGFSPDGTPIVFFAMRFEGPANCQVNWQDDATANRGLLASGNRGIGLELPSNAGFLSFTAGGGVSTQPGPLACATVHTGFWRFTAGNITNNVNLIYPDFPVAQLPMKP